MTYKVLGQSNPLATSETDLYECPIDTSTVISSLIVCNQGLSTTFRVSISVSGGITQDKDFIYYDITLPSNSTFIATVGLTLSVGDIIRVYSGTANVSFSLYGSEIE